MVRQTYAVNPDPPAHSRLKQQKLKAWQPILTAGTVLPTFFVVGVIFIPLGAVLLHASNTVFEQSFDYTNCSRKQESSEEGSLEESCQNLTKYNPTIPCRCKAIKFNVSEDLQDVYIYYGLTNFYQNHRRYVKSRDDKQLLGKVANYEPSADCAPFQADSNGTWIAPCGAIANSMFNDSFYLKSNVGPVTLDYSGIAWPSDRNAKFKNPADIKDFDKVAKPPGWQKSAVELQPGNYNENGFQNESFIVWMRISALPTFRKLHSRLQSLPKGEYTLEIDYNYPVYEFDGKKRFIISTTSWAGGKNPFLGVAYIVVGCLCILTGTIFFFIHLKFGKSLTDMANIGR